MSEQKPSICRIVQYTLSEQDVKAINGRRNTDAGLRVHNWNAVEVGQMYPMVIVRVWGEQPDSSVNGQVLLDGTDSHWVTSVSQGEGERHWVWPPRV